MSHAPYASSLTGRLFAGFSSLTGNSIVPMAIPLFCAINIRSIRMYHILFSVVNDLPTFIFRIHGVLGHNRTVNSHGVFLD